MAVRTDCRHYLARTTPAGDALERCRLSANAEAPFACPDTCMFFENRLSGAGWAQAPRQPMSNTADGLARLAPEPKRKGWGKKRH